MWCRRSIRALTLCALTVIFTACSPKHMALNRMAAALVDASAVYERDNDPEFVRLAAPGTLKMVEMLLSQAPDHTQLLLTGCSGFTEYAYGFLHVDAQLKTQDAAAAAELKARAAKMYQRARGYCLHGMEVRHPGLTLASIARDPVAALARTTVDDVPWLYWTAASWGADLSLSANPLLRVTELASVRALLNRAKTLDDTWDRGAIYEALIAFDALPPLLGGSPASARADFDRAMALSSGTSVFACVALASATADPVEKRRLLEQALAIDVSQLTSRRLTSLIAQRYARALLASAH
jgi:hypothetical protein